MGEGAGRDAVEVSSRACHSTYFEMLLTYSHAMQEINLSPQLK